MAEVPPLVSISPGRRLSAVLPEVFRFARLRRRATPDQLATAGVRLGGIFAWGIDQGRFFAEFLGPALTEACQTAAFPAHRPSPIPGITITKELPADVTAIARFQADGDSGQPLRILLSLPSEGDKMAVDGRLIEYMVGLVPRHKKYVSKTDLVTLIEDVVQAAALDGDLAEEAKGIRIAAGSRWFQAPELVRHSGGMLVETGDPGIPIEDLPAGQRDAAYRDAVLAWSRMLFDEGILVVTVRRGAVLAVAGQLELTRWAGARRASPAAGDLVRNLLLAAFDCTSSGQQAARERAEQLLADGFGIAGSPKEVESDCLSQVSDLCLSLISANEPIKLRRQKLPRIMIKQSSQYSREGRIELFRLLRQLVWLRDLGFACGVADLTLPWRELASELAPLN